ncbi:Redoxin domain protein [Truepera radiovictrix DSM 17093]|uniref:Redoxin domain protein n=2 Tax=Truepera TaxID=332248 RepID=D7CTM9_TRURR|nr:Redoxin domain protein [Truepera radiovictrix DSM 17093]
MSLPWRLGPGPGTVVTLPEVETVQGDVIATGVPSLVFFTMLSNSVESAFEHAALATVWQERYPGVQVILVDTRSDAEEVRRWVQATGVEVSVVADADDAFEEAFDTNRLPILYLLDESGVIQDKIVGGDLGRLTEFNQVLAWAASRAWEKVVAQRSDWLVVGKAPYRELADVPLGGGHPTVVYHTDPLCSPCQEVAEGLQRELNALTKRYPEVSIVILEVGAKAGDVEALHELLEGYVELYGREAAPAQLLMMVERGRLAGAETVQLPREGWAQNIKLVTYEPGDTNDPGRWWGQTPVPGLMVFDATGVYRGPAPLWLGPFRAEALREAITTLIADL